MVYTRQELFEAATKLPIEERQSLVDELYLSLHGITQHEFDQACSQEVRRREGLLTDDPSRRRTLEQVLDSVTQELKK